MGCCRKFDVDEYNLKLRNRFRGESETDESHCHSDECHTKAKLFARKKRRFLKNQSINHSQEHIYKLKRKSGH